MLNKLTPQQIDLMIDVLNDSIVRNKREMEMFTVKEDIKVRGHWEKEIKKMQKIVDILEGKNVKNN